MLLYIPYYVTIIFLVTVFITGIFLWSAIKESFEQQSRKIPVWITLVLFFWLAVQGELAFTGFYVNTKSSPPRFILAVAPALLFILILFITKPGKKFIDSLPISILTYIHSIRILVELILYWLFINKTVPQVMTFAGRNFDIIAGITAPVIAYIAFVQKKLSPKALLAWNIICLLLLINIVVLAFLSAPFAFQQLGFEQPNIAVLYFPFIWLPSFIVPIILFSHLVSIRQLST